MPRLRPTHLFALLLAVLLAPAHLVTAAAAGPAQHRVTITLAEASGRVRLNRHATVSGSVTDASTHQPLTRVAVTLQVRSRAGWATPPGSASVTDAAGHFTMRAPTYYYGHHVLRVLVAAQSVGRDVISAPATSPERSLSVPVPYRAAGSASAARVSGIRFDPCTPIPYWINPAGAPRRARALVAAALAKARAASGLTFVYAGSSSAIPFSGERNDGLPRRGIGFAWATPRQVRGLGSGELGMGGGGWAVNDRQISSGVVIDRTFGYRQGWTGPNSIGGLLLHEIGHALGLEHVKDPSQVMYPVNVGAPNGNYNRGDIHALERVGLDAGCL